MIVNEVAARYFFPGNDPVGQRVEIGSKGTDSRVGYVAGVAGGIRDGVSVGNPSPPIVYLPLRPSDMARPSAQG